VTERYETKLSTDHDFANCTDHRKSVSGLHICEEKSSCPIAWSSKLQTLVATSTTEAEVVAAATGVEKDLWFLKLFREIRGSLDLYELTLCCNTEAAIALMAEERRSRSSRQKQTH
jgi:hypothetical protein